MDTTEIEIERHRRAELKQRYCQLFAAFSEILYRHDPAGIHFEVNSDEYEPEVGTILPRALNAQRPDEIVPILREELSRWFGVGLQRPGVTYEAMAADLFTALLTNRQ